MRLPGARAAHERPRRTGDAHSANRPLARDWAHFAPPTRFCAGCRRIRTSRTSRNAPTGGARRAALLLRLERQHDPQQDVCDAQQPTRGQGEHHHDDTDDDRIDVEIIGHARADAAYERLSRTEQPFFTRHASSRSIASTASTHDGEGSSSRSTRTVEMRRRRIA